MESWRVENCVIYVCATIGVVGLYAMSGSWHSLWMLVMLMFISSQVNEKKK